MKLMEDDLGRGSGQGGRQLSLEMLRHERRTRRWTCCGLHADSWFLSALFPRLATICVREGGRERERKDFNQIDFKISIKILYINSLSFLIIICR